MKKNISFLAPVFLISIVFLFSSCLKDHCSRTYNIITPVYTKLSVLRSAVQSKPAAAIVNTGKLYIRDKWIFLNEQNKGIHVIDNSNPSHPVKTSFINIPGSIDMSVKENILYADLYCDLAAIDISNPKNISVAKFLTNTFPEKAVYSSSTNPDSINITTGWTSRDTVVNCDEVRLLTDCINCSTPFYYSAASASSTGKAVGAAGSMARFATVDNYMYAVSTSNLSVININEAANPLFIQKKNIGWDIETIFPYKNKLYIGAGSSMSVYDLLDPADPQRSSWNGHWCSRDPVVADDNYAYVTLHEANVCGSKVNQLEIYNLSVPYSPVLLKTYPLTNPQGLSKDGNLLFICDDGLKIYDVTDASNIKLIKHFPGMHSYDVIANGGIAYLVAKDGLYQYDYNSVQNIHLLSKL
ncbi:MAG: hypothetical protein ABJC98_05155 [Bacteroidota bacterium]